MYEVTSREALSVKPQRRSHIVRTGPAQGMDVADSHLLLFASRERGASCSQYRDHAKTNDKVIIRFFNAHFISLF